MSRNIVQKIILEHLAEGDMIDGQEIAIRIDQALIHDATGQMSLLHFEALGLPRIKIGLGVVYADHNTVQIGPENMNDHHFLSTAGRKFGLHFSRPGNGICHQVHLERFSKPGQTLLGADSHTTTGGGVGMLAIGAGGFDVAVAMSGIPFYMIMPKVVKIELVGKLQPWVSAKDVALEMLHQLSVSGGRGKILEFSGDGVKHLSATQRATVTNMSIETGAITAVFPSDDMTRQFFMKQNRLSDWKEIAADPGANYDEKYIIDLANLEPLIAKPHSPDNVCTVRELEGLPVDQVCIGSCTNSSLEDLMKVGAILRGRLVAPDVSLTINHGSRQTQMEMYITGTLGDMIKAGARVLENVCGFCGGIDQSPRSGGVSLRTSNRNFRGRSGTEDAELYLVSPETAAASAIGGKIIDPRRLGEAPTIKLPNVFITDDRMILLPASDSNQIEIRRGPTIAPLPQFDRLPISFRGQVLIKMADNVTTDDIVPGGANILKLRGNIPAISKFIFSRIDPSFADRAQAVGTGFIVGGENYGQGSSREHAALGSRYLGVRAIIAKSFARIHKSNLINYGILPLEFVNPADYDSVQTGDRLEMRDLIRRAEYNQDIIVDNLTSGQSFYTRINASKRLVNILLSGGLLNYAKEKS